MQFLKEQPHSKRGIPTPTQVAAPMTINVPCHQSRESTLIALPFAVVYISLLKLESPKFLNVVLKGGTLRRKSSLH